MTAAPRSVASMVGALLLVAAACGGQQSQASSEEPLPTIGLGSDLGEPGSVSGSADVRAIGADEIDTIVMIGDSITVASKPALETAFADLGFPEPVIVAAQGKRMAESFGNNPSGAAVAEFLTTPVADDAADDGLGEEHTDELWIVALGTNDVNQYSGADEIAAAVNEVLDNVPDDASLVWVDTYWRDQPDGTAEVNAIVADRLQRRGDAVVAAWSFYAAGEGVMRSDGVHPSTAGAEVFADVVAATAADFLGR